METLKWCEARRIGSEPAGLHSWLSAASLAECGCSREEDEDDVFTITGGRGEGDDSWSTCEENEDNFGKIICVGPCVCVCVCGST